MEFKITKDMVDKFALLTGDHSSLHMSSKFARRSIYRENVVHGLLPVMFLSFLDLKCEVGKTYNLKRIAANFIKPVFVDDKLLLETNNIGFDSDSGEGEYEYVIRNSSSGTVLVAGTFSVVSSKRDFGEENIDADVISGSEGAMLVEPVEEQDLGINDIKKGDSQSFRFNVSDASKKELYDILAASVLRDGEGDSCVWKAEDVPVNFLTTSLVSSFAGMCIPGRSATILNFQILFNKNIQVNEEYRLKGEVVFKSSGNVIAEKISIYTDMDNEDIYADCKINVRVNERPVKMINARTIKTDALDLQLNDKVVLVTGASRGIGEVTAKLLALHGCKTVVNYFRGEEDALRIVDEIKSEGGKAIAVQADVSNVEQVREMVEKVSVEYGPIYAVVNNAVRNFSAVDFLELTWEEFQKDIDVTVKGAFNCCKEIIPGMIKNGGGRIVNISSIATDNPPPKQLKYTVTKSALIGLTRSLAAEFARENILVNTVVPNMVETDLTAGIPKTFISAAANENPMGRICSGLDVARSVLFLISSLSSYTTGQRIMVTGGEIPLL